MKISIVTVALSHGGAERVAVTLANGFIQRGHQVTILTDLNEPIDFIPDKRIKLVGILKERKEGLKRWIKAIITIRQIAKQDKPDVIIGIMGLCTLMTYLACLGLRVPVVMTEHDSFERPKNAPMSKKEWVFKFCINKLYNHITVLAEADKKYIGNRLNNITVMPNPLLLNSVYDVPTKDNIILAAGRIDSWYVKGFDILIKAWARIEKKYPNWQINIAGILYNPRDYMFIPNLIKDLKLENRVHLIGFQKDVEKLYRKSNIFVLSSRFEGFGLVLIEAMSQGCAPVACDYKGRQREILCPEGVSGFKSQDSSMEICENGILCEPDNVEVLALALEKMIVDDEYRNHVQKNAINRSKYYTLDNTITRWEDYIHSFIST